MHKNITGVIAKMLAVTLAVGTVGTAVPADDANAAAKPKLSKSKVSVNVGKKAKITIKNVKAKKVKKLTVKSAKKAIAAVKKNGKTGFTVTGKKAGKTTVTASVKVGKKTTKLKLAVTVKAAGPQNNVLPVPSTAATVAPPAASNAPAASVTPPASQTEVPPASQNPGGDGTPGPLVNYTEDFENGEGDWYARGNEGCRIEITDEAHEGTAALLMTGREGEDGKGHAWNGPALDLTKSITPGGKYRVSFWAKIPESEAGEAWGNRLDLMVSSAQYYSQEDKEEDEANEGGDNLHCENYPRDTWYPIKSDEWTKIETEFSVPDYFYEFIFYIETTERNGRVQFGKASFLIDDFQLERIAAPKPFDSTLIGIKDAYASHIPTMGVAVTYDQLMNENTLGFVKHHFNSITMGNEMKLDELMGTNKTLMITDEAAAGYVVDDAYKACPDNKDADGNVIVPEIRFSKMDKILKIAKDNGLKVRIHSPFWHSQMPQYFFTKNYTEYKDDPSSATSFPERYTDKETMYTRQEMYVRTMLKHIIDGGYGDVISSYDVVNEYLHMQFKSGKYTNYWQCIFGDKDLNSPYVKKAFAVAHDVLKENNLRDKVSLIYNDFSTYDIVDSVVSLINNMNAKDDEFNPNGEKICDGIGMQSHVGVEKPGAEFYEAAIEAFHKAGFEIQITELDVASPTVTSETSEADKTDAWKKNADAYAAYMNAILRQKAAGANITSVTVWGITDASSWIKDSSPLLFGENVSDKKPSYDAFIKAAQDFGK